MPEYNFNDPIDNQEPIVNNVDDVTPVQPINPVESVQQSNYQSVQQRTSPQIPNDKVPFVVLVGPPESGKSMVLKRLGSYLRDNEELKSAIEANSELFKDDEYQSYCVDFNNKIGEKDSAFPNTVDYLLADVYFNGNIKAHFLEAPGEHFFDKSHPDKEPDNHEFEGYMDKIASENRKVFYIIILDLDSPTSFRNDKNLREKYEKKMIKLYNKYVIGHPAKVILLYNKVDLAKGGKWANAAMVSNPKAVLENAKQMYPKLFFTRKFLWWEIPNYMFVPFCTGSFNDGYTASEDSYPKMLWEAITKIW